MDIRDKLDFIWNSIGSESAGYLDSNFEQIAPNLLELLIASLFTDGYIDIGYFIDNGTEGSLVSYDVYDSDKGLHLKLSQDSCFYLELTLFDLDQEQRRYLHKLIDEEILLVPKGLIDIMTEVKDSQTTMTVAKNRVRD